MFNINLLSPCPVGKAAIHTAGTVHLNDERVASVIRVVTLDGLLAWRIFDYDVDKKDALEEFFLEQDIVIEEGCDGFPPHEVTFSRPFEG